MGRLPENLKSMQRAALRGLDDRAAFVRSRLFVCPDCLALKGTPVLRHEFRVDTLTGDLLCSGCHRRDILSVDMLVSPRYRGSPAARGYLLFSRSRAASAWICW